MDFKPGRGRKVAFWRTLAEAEGLPSPASEEDYANLYLRWRLYGYAESEFAKRYIDKLRKSGYRLVNKDLDHCVCGAKIKRRWLIVNDVARLYAFIGSECKEKFFLPAPTTPRMALMQAVMLLSVQISEAEKLGLNTRTLRRLLGQALRYVEKLTKFRELYVTKRFAELLELYTGIRWKWKTWEERSKEGNLISKRV